MYKVLTIAGSDSSAGAGIQADLKTFVARGVYGMTVITAVTAQNARKVSAIFPLPAAFVARQIDAVMEDMGADAWKTGMLANSEIVNVVANRAKRYSIKRLVVDPVMVASSGRRLLDKDAIDTLKKILLPLAFLVTPNIAEAEALTGRKIVSLSDIRESAKAINSMGAMHVVIKGGHLSSPRHSGERQRLQNRFWASQNDGKEVIDILFDGEKFLEFSSPKVKRNNVHGTGCIFASCIAAELAKGRSLREAVKIAKKYVYNVYFAS